MKKRQINFKFLGWEVLLHKSKKKDLGAKMSLRAINFIGASSYSSIFYVWKEEKDTDKTYIKKRRCLLYMQAIAIAREWIKSQSFKNFIKNIKTAIEKINFL